LQAELLEQAAIIRGDMTSQISRLELQRDDERREWERKNQV
jgi:hypothetical protein